MEKKASFKKPTIKGYGRAFVRLYCYFGSAESWQQFLESYRVQHVPFGMVRNGDCAVQVVSRATGEVVALGLEIPHQIRYHTNVATVRSFWTEEFMDANHKRIRIIEVGSAIPLKDDLAAK